MELDPSESESFYTEGTNKAPVITLHDADKILSCKIYRYGAHITSLKVDDEERLWLSEDAVLDETGLICGGIGVVFPHYESTSHFSREAERRHSEMTTTDKESLLPLQRIASTCYWTIQHLEDSKAIFRLQDDYETFKIWPHAFALEYQVSLVDRGIRCQLKVCNIGGLKSSWEFSGALHCYLACPSTDDAVLLGFRKTSYVDHVCRRAGVELEPRKARQRGPVNVHTEAMRSAHRAHLKRGGHLDRLYLESPNPVRVEELSSGRIMFELRHSQSLPLLGLYNPWKLPVSERPADFCDQGYLQTVAVAPTVSGVVVRPGFPWTGWIELTVPIEYIPVNDDKNETGASNSPFRPPPTVTTNTANMLSPLHPPPILSTRSTDTHDTFDELYQAGHFSSSTPGPES